MLKISVCKEAARPIISQTLASKWRGCGFDPGIASNAPTPTPPPDLIPPPPPASPFVPRPPPLPSFKVVRWVSCPFVETIENSRACVVQVYACLKITAAETKHPGKKSAEIPPTLEMNEWTGRVARTSSSPRRTGHKLREGALFLINAFTWVIEFILTEEYLWAERVRLELQEPQGVPQL